MLNHLMQCRSLYVSLHLPEQVYNGLVITVQVDRLSLSLLCWCIQPIWCEGRRHDQKGQKELCQPS